MSDSKVRITNFDDAFNNTAVKTNTSTTKAISPDFTQLVSKDDNDGESKDHVRDNRSLEMSDFDNKNTSSPYNNSEISAGIKEKQSGKEIKQPKQKSEWIKGKYSITSSLKTLIPGFIIAAVAFAVPSIISSDQLVMLLFQPSEMEKQPDFLKNNLPTILNASLYLTGCIALLLSIKAKSQGKLFIYDSYLLHKQSILRKQKILLPQIVSVDIHWTPFSLLKNIGNLEISSIKGDIIFKNCPNPDQIKSMIEQKCRDFNEV
ncbi:MAG: hypothetical protein ACI92O_000472 [Colwellia sp.]|jgi:hypothetical protein